ncbi:hypothetical protein QAD02_016374 [Eretmocerus hayati]|uniref:Uncharacterized protein n=1 Tax=Eretmocerus hayati TaxID=131215 RepID=A0ACC2PBA2_9HYME|nr:hypothetical protein QAD02_016374 [Eretmocerus hayati]
MFSTKEKLQKKTGPDGVGRFEYLQMLINEYCTTKSRDAKEQVLANLANFAYDPINYEYLWRLKILDIFFSALNESNSKLVSFAAGGICNICLDPLSQKWMYRTEKIDVVSSLLKRSEESVVLSAITTLYYLDRPESRGKISSPENVKIMLEHAKSPNRRIKNLANIFLHDLCGLRVNQQSSNQQPQSSKSSTQVSSASSKSNKISLDKNIAAKNFVQGQNLSSSK